jgi:transposase-like protein
MRARYDRLDRQQMQMQELSYKLGQAHQEIARLERMLAERSYGRMDEAK